MMSESLCEFCGRSFDTEWGLGQHIGRYCDEAPEEDRDEIASRIMEGNSPFADQNHSQEVKDQISTTKTEQDQSEAWKQAMERKSGDANPAKRESVREKISKAVSGKSHPLYGCNRDEETIEKISDSMRGRELSEEHIERLSEGHSGAELTEEHKRKISETLSGREYSEERIRKMLTREREFVPDLGYGIDSEWERQMAFYLESLDIPYEREPCFHLSDSKHFPDFLVDTCIVEVKGWEGFSNENKISKCMEKYPNYTYVVVGADIQSDIRISWAERDELFDILYNRVDAL